MQTTAAGVKKNPYLGYSLLWKPRHGKMKADRPPLTYTDLLKQNTLLEVPDERAHYLHRPTQTEYST